MAGRRPRSKGTDRAWRRRRRASPPKTWIYRNLTPWRIHACFDADGPAPRETAHRAARRGPMRDARCCRSRRSARSPCPHEDARALNTLDMRRLGQIEVRPAPSELLTTCPRAS